MGETSTLFKAIKTDGSFVDRSTTEDVFYYDYLSDPGSSGEKSFRLATSLTHQQVSDSPYGGMTLSSLGVEDGVTVPIIMRLLRLYLLLTGTLRGRVYMRETLLRARIERGRAPLGVMDLLAGSPLSVLMPTTLGIRMATVPGVSLQ